MKRHPGFENAVILWPEGNRPLPPIRRIADPDRIAAACAALNPGAFQRGRQRVGNISGPVSGSGSIQPGFQPFHQRGLSPFQIIGGVPRKIVRQNGV